MSHDVGAYFIGRYRAQPAVGRERPNKTLEGTAGGGGVAIVVTVVVVGIFGIALIGGDFFRVVVFALLCALVAPIGDLCESFVAGSRHQGLRDDPARTRRGARPIRRPAVRPAADRAFRHDPAWHLDWEAEPVDRRPDRAGASGRASHRIGSAGAHTAPEQVPGGRQAPGSTPDRVGTMEAP